jgi:chemosensory pili system protein ChpB (putative protein-glutamate methylesterase)
MSEKRVALFFDDAELGSHLRTTLSEQGAQIAHEGPLSSFDEQQLRQAAVDVLVVNLDDAVDDATLDRIYGLIESGNTPVVFNDAQASKGLDGWDRARWARHLVAKVLAHDAIDPPRPENAREIDAPVVVETAAEPATEYETAEEPLEAHVEQPVHATADEPAFDLLETQADDPIDEAPLVHDAVTPDTETLAAELEALLASDDSVDPPQDDFGSGLKFGEHDELPALHDGDFSARDAGVRADAPVETASSVPVAEHDFGSGLTFSEHDELPPLHDGNFGSHDAAIHADSPVEVASSAHALDSEFGSGLRFSEHDELPALHDGNFGSHDAAIHAEAPVEVASSAHTLDDEFGAGLTFGEHDTLPALHDGDFGSHDAAIHAEGAFELESPAPQPIKVDAPAFHADIDHLTLAALDDEDVKPPVIEKATLAQQTSAHAAPEWGFVEDSDFSPPLPTEQKAKQGFGVEKVSAADYLAPDAERVDEAVVPRMTLELVSLEEAIAPKAEYEPQETRLEELDAAFARLLVLGAARDSQASLTAFLAGLPSNLRLPILLIQHQNSTSVDQLAQTLAKDTPLPVKVAATGMRAKMGEVVLVPRGQNVRILRDGRVELSAANDETSEQAPSIDSSFTMAANVFGRDTVAIVFSGHATDAVAGAQAIHDRGGQVWVESSMNDHYADMVHGVLAERLASFSGSPQELAVRLVEDFR